MARAVRITLFAALLAGCSPVLYALQRARAGASARAVTLGRVVSGSTSAATDHHRASCGGRGASGDELWRFAPPATGEYRVRVRAGYDSVLAVLRGDSEELACNDDVGSSTDSEVVLRMTAGESYTLVVDGYQGDVGAYTLVVERAQTTGSNVGLPVTAPLRSARSTHATEDPATMDRRCASAPTLPLGLSAGRIEPGVRSAVLTCAPGAQGGDVIYRLVVPDAGTLSVAVSSVFDAAVELRRTCGPATDDVIECNDDAPDSHHTRLTAAVTPGTYYVIVSRYAGGDAGPFTAEAALATTP